MLRQLDAKKLAFNGLGISAKLSHSVWDAA